MAEADGQWHVASGAEAVIGVLDRLGVLSGELLAKDGWDVTESENGAGAPAGDGDAAAGAQQPMSSAPPIVPAWQWLVAAAASGLAVGALARPTLAAYLRSRERGPRQQLLDLGGAVDSGQPDPNPAKAPALVLDLGDLDPANLPR
jgi:hypothetical protein